jgi:large subunit ribosomal protein L10
MLRADKERIVQELVERLQGAATLLIADYRGLTMSEIDALRTRLLESGARFSVVKNTLTRRAAEEAGVGQLLELLEGPTAIAFIQADGDPVAAAKALNETARANDVLVIRGGIMEGNVISDAEVRSLATLPAAEVLRAQLASAVAAPLTTIVALFTAPLRDLVNVIDARINQLQEQGEAVPEPEAEAAPAEEPTAEAPDEPAEESTEDQSPETEQVSGEGEEEE